MYFITKDYYDKFFRKNGIDKCVLDNGKMVWINKIKSKYYCYICDFDKIAVSNNVKSFYSYVIDHYKVEEVEKEYFKKAWENNYELTTS